MAFLLEKFLLEKTGEEEGLKIVLEQTELLVETLSEEGGDTQFGVASLLKHELMSEIFEPLPEDVSVLLCGKFEPIAD